jgi:hypothetical protein
MGFKGCATTAAGASSDDLSKSRRESDFISTFHSVSPPSQLGPVIFVPIRFVAMGAYAHREFLSKRTSSSFNWTSFGVRPQSQHCLTLPPSCDEGRPIGTGACKGRAETAPLPAQELAPAEAQTVRDVARARRLPRGTAGPKIPIFQKLIHTVVLKPRRGFGHIRGGRTT